MVTESFLNLITVVSFGFDITGSGTQERVYMYNKNRLEYLSWPVIGQKIKQGYETVIICTASIEQHGPHLPEFTDTRIGAELCDRVADKLGSALIAPTITVGRSEHHLAMPGSLSFRPEIYQGVIEDYVNCYKNSGFKNIVLIASHGGNIDPLLKIVDELRIKYPELNLVCPLTVELLMGVMIQMSEEYHLGQGVSGHAGAFETAIMLHLTPELVNMDVAEPGFTDPMTREVAEKLWKEGMKGLSKVGIIGDPTVGVTAEMGAKYLNITTDILVNVIKEELTKKPVE